jgi:glycerophosphoryl diester phosphodiesterase
MMRVRKSAMAVAAGIAAVTLGLSAAVAAQRPVPPQKTQFDLQAHRGGIGLTTESTLTGFAKAIELGVTTLELDTQVTEDQRVIVTHDRQISAQKCRDTAPTFAGDPEYPYVGKFITNLTLEQVQTVECGYQALPDFPSQEVVSGPMVELREVFDLVQSYQAKRLMLNIETKVEAAAPQQTAPRDLFVRRVWEEIRDAGISKQVTIQSFDWGALMVMHSFAPQLPKVALTNFDFLQVGRPGASVWLGGIDVDDFGGDFVAAAASIDGITALSPVQGFPQNGRISDPGFDPYPDEQMIADAHARGLKVIPWTIDDPATMDYFIDLGVDGIITNYPDRLRDVMADNGMRLPKPHTRTRQNSASLLATLASAAPVASPAASVISSRVAAPRTGPGGRDRQETSTALVPLAPSDRPVSRPPAVLYARVGQRPPLGGPPIRGVSSPPVSQESRSVSRRRRSTASARRTSATWCLRRGSPRH